ncbi:MAG: amidohydrolase [Acidimicrobiales bacterium]|nr:amidohydrolase [Acidimicrobiales bacterium]
MTRTAWRLVADRIIPVEPGGIISPIDGSRPAIDIDRFGVIVGCGLEANLPPAPPDRRTVGGLLMPGLVNSHAHTPMTLMRSVGDGLPLRAWLTDAVWPREGIMSPDDAFAGMLLGSVEMLLAGVTTSCEMYLYEEELVRAVDQTGARMVITPGVLAVLHASSFGTGADRAEAIREFAALHHDPASRITVGVGPHSTYDLKPGQIGELASLARDLDSFVHVHLEETQVERQQVIADYGKPATEVLAEVGVFDGAVLAAHGVWLSSSDRKILSHANVSIAHNPVSNLKLGSGIMPLVETLADGVRVGLGTDGPASNDNLSLWQELALAPLLSRGTNHNSQAISADQALRLATIDGARALGLDVGRLAPGCPADIIRLDLDHPSLAPALEEDLVTSVVFAGGPHLVTDVWVAGMQVVAERGMTTVNTTAIVADAKKRAQRLARES